MTKEEILKIVKEKNVKFIRMWFTDLLGQLKSFSITQKELEKGLEEGLGFDGSSIVGYQDIQESDMIAMPDTDTFSLLPWRESEKEGNIAKMFCDVLNPDGSNYEGDPRYILKRTLKKIEEKGYKAYMGPELEFFLFKDDKFPQILDIGGYFDLTPLDIASDFRRDAIITLEKMGIEVEYSHHEVGASQHEIDLRYKDALEMADITLTYKLVVKEIARKHGFYASFMPKPIFGINGSGMHTHQSLFKGDKNAFFNKDDKYFLSDIAKHYIAGIIKYIPDFCSVIAQWVNSYKRLVPGYEAPVYIAWSQRNRSALIRVPYYKPGHEKSTRIEVRSPDPACNPYLAFACMLSAGLKGIEEKLPLPEPMDRNLYELTDSERKKMGIEPLPKDLGHAIDNTKNSKFMREILGDHAFEKFVELKEREWEEYRVQVTEYEIKRYFPIL